MKCGWKISDGLCEESRAASRRRASFRWSPFRASPKSTYHRSRKRLGFDPERTRDRPVRLRHPQSPPIGVPWATRTRISTRRTWVKTRCLGQVAQSFPSCATGLGAESLGHFGGDSGPFGEMSSLAGCLLERRAKNRSPMHQTLIVFTLFSTSARAAGGGRIKDACY